MISDDMILKGYDSPGEVNAGWSSGDQSNPLLHSDYVNELNENGTGATFSLESTEPEIKETDDISLNNSTSSNEVNIEVPKSDTELNQSTNLADTSAYYAMEKDKALSSSTSPYNTQGNNYLSSIDGGSNFSGNSYYNSNELSYNPSSLESAINCFSKIKSSTEGLIYDHYTTINQYGDSLNFGAELLYNEYEEHYIRNYYEDLSEYSDGNILLGQINDDYILGLPDTLQGIKEILDSALYEDTHLNDVLSNEEWLTKKTEMYINLGFNESDASKKALEDMDNNKYNLTLASLNNDDVNLETIANINSNNRLDTINQLVIDNANLLFDAEANCNKLTDSMSLLTYTIEVNNKDKYNEYNESYLSSAPENTAYLKFTGDEVYEFDKNNEIAERLSSVFNNVNSIPQKLIYRDDDTTVVIDQESGSALVQEYLEIVGTIDQLTGILNDNY